MSLPIRRVNPMKPEVDFRFQKPLEQISTEERDTLNKAVENFYKKYKKDMPDQNSDEAKIFNDKTMPFDMGQQKRATGEKCTLIIKDGVFKLSIQTPSEKETFSDTFWENCDTCVLIAQRMLFLNPPENQEKNPKS